LVVIGRMAGAKVAGDDVEGLARSCAFEVIAGVYHIREIIPCVGGRIPGPMTLLLIPELTSPPAIIHLPL
jgi:hypothetical protein